MRNIFKVLLVFVVLLGNVYYMFANQDNEAYIKKYYKIAMREMNDYGIPASITLAQGILESAAGTSRLAVQANNHFGMVKRFIMMMIKIMSVSESMNVQKSLL